MSVIKGIPKSEHIWTKIVMNVNNVYYITSKNIGDYYFLYKLNGDKAVKLGKAKSPLELEEKYIDI